MVCVCVCVDNLYVSCTVLDPIQTKLVKEMLPEVIDPLLNIINSSLSLGYVPKTLSWLWLG